MIEALEKEYAIAAQREWFIRDAAFILATENICGMDVLPMTLRHYLALRTIRSPFMVGGEALPQDAFIFLWQVSPDYHPRNTKAKQALWKRCKAFRYIKPPAVHFKFLMTPWQRRTMKRFERFQILKEEIQKYIADALMDRPPNAGFESKSYFSDAAAICHRFATHYNWPVEVTMSLPLKCLFQFYKITDAKIAMDNQKRPVMFNPSDAIQNKILEELNQN